MSRIVQTLLGALIAACILFFEVADASAQNRMPMLPPDAFGPAPNLEKGVVSVSVLNEHQTYLPGQTVFLDRMSAESPESGRLRRQQVGAKSGEATFHLPPEDAGTKWVFVACTDRDPSKHPNPTYCSPPFQLPANQGFRGTLHSYPDDMQLAHFTQFAVQGVDTILQPADDGVLVQQRVDWINLERRAWRLSDRPDERLVLPVPAGAMAFKLLDDNHYFVPALVASLTPDGVAFSGAIVPGNTAITYEYRVPIPNGPFQLGLPPRVLNARVRSVLRRDMTVSIAGFPEPSPEGDETDSRLLGTIGHWSLNDSPTTLRITYTGYPQPSPARWIAAVLALLLIVFGMAGVWGHVPSRKLRPLENGANSPPNTYASQP